MAADPSTAWIRKLLEENEHLKAAALKQGGINGGLTLALGQLSEDLKKATAKSELAVSESEASKVKASELASQIDDAIKRIAEKDEQLQNDVTTINGLKTNVEHLDKEVKARDELVKKHEERQAQDDASILELKGELGSTKKQLETTSNQLKELEDLSWDMGTMSKDEILNEINKIYTDAKSLAMNFFGGDVPENVLQDAKTIAEISQVIEPIPFVPTNSLNAKKARMTGFMLVLGYRLAVRIFVPVYYQVPAPGEEYGVFQQDGNDISFMLSSLAEVDPKRELHLRSVLVATSPDVQKEIALTRARDIADEIYDNFVDLLGEDREREIDFSNQIRALCDAAVESWGKLRVLGVKIEPFTDAEESEKYWVQAEMDIGGQARPQSPSSNGNLKKQQSNGKTNSLASKPSIHSLSTASRVTSVWPGFCYGKDEVLKRGYMLVDSQIRKAREEMNSRRTLRAAVRASAPQMHRRTTGRKSRPAVVGPE
ncbi:hypothetical protein F4861DRAFT_440553 [Xylaria intraflava]|nr:hypothetical protein F4861DRAFT_440553 [Xylaria intraflava]